MKKRKPFIIIILLAILTITFIILYNTDSQIEKKGGKLATLNPTCQNCNSLSSEEISNLATGEYFIGPFSNWKNLKNNYGAIGDGIADDTEAIQKALDDLKIKIYERNYSILYIPSGNYRITQTLNLSRELDLAFNGEAYSVSIIGENPETTKIFWDGELNGTMFSYNPTNSFLSRITFDGKNKADYLIKMDGPFSTANSFSDLIFQDAGTALFLGNSIWQRGIAEVSIIRCKFLRQSKVAIVTSDWNTGDVWIWNSEFTDNNIGVASMYPYPPYYGQGWFSVYQSIFKNSTYSDLYINSGLYFSLRDSISINSKALIRFFANNAGTSTITLQRNIIVNNETEPLITIGNRGPLIILDNIFKTNPAVPTITDYSYPILTHGSSILSVNNTYTSNNPINAAYLPNYGRVRKIQDKIIDRNSISDPIIPEIKFLQKINPPVFNLIPGSNQDIIQEAINNAANLKGQKPVIYFPKGTYPINKTLIIPKESDIQLIGEGILDTSILAWTGQENGTVLLIQGPNNKAYLGELMIETYNRANGIIINNTDQINSRVLLDQFQVIRNAQDCIMINKVKYSQIALKDIGGNPCNKTGIDVIGLGDGNESSHVTIYSGGFAEADSTYPSNSILQVENNGWLLARDLYHEDPANQDYAYHNPNNILKPLHGSLTIHGGRLAGYMHENNGIIIQNFKGKLSFIGVNFFNQFANSYPIYHNIQLKGDNSKASIMFIGAFHSNSEDNYTFDYWLNNTSLTSNLGTILSHFFYNNRTRDGSGNILSDSSYTEKIPDTESISDAFVLSMLEQTRSVDPLVFQTNTPLNNDIRLYRLSLANVKTGLDIKGNPIPENECGNKICDTNENCSKCPADCGICPVTKKNQTVSNTNLSSQTNQEDNSSLSNEKNQTKELPKKDKNIASIYFIIAIAIIILILCIIYFILKSTTPHNFN